METVPNDSRIPGGPITQKIRDLRIGHRASTIWLGHVDVKPSKLRGNGRRIEKWREMLIPEQIDIINTAGFGNAYDLFFGNHDVALCAALAERWWPSTSSFHFPFGEMTITLEDVSRILGVTITGAPLVFRSLDAESQPLGIPIPTGDAILLSWLYDNFEHIPANPTQVQIENYTRAYLFALCGATLFPDGTGNKVNHRFLAFFADLGVTPTYAWGAAILAHLFHYLDSYASTKSNGIFGCVTLLQVWAYEHLPVGRPLRPLGGVFPRAKAWRTKEYCSDPHHSLMAYRTGFDSLTATEVIFAPVLLDGEDPERWRSTRRTSYFTGCIIGLHIVQFYPGNRVMRQFGLIQTIPPEPYVFTYHQRINSKVPREAVDDWNCRFNTHPMVETAIGVDTPVPWSTPEYQEWFGSPRIHNPRVIFQEARQLPQGYWEPLYHDFFTRTMQQGNVISQTLVGDSHSDPREVLQSTLDVLHAPYSQGVFVPDRESTCPLVPVRVRRKGRRRHQPVQEDEMEMEMEMDPSAGASGHASVSGDGGVREDIDTHVCMSYTSMMDDTQASPPASPHEGYGLRTRRQRQDYRRMLDGDCSGHGKACQH